MKKCLIMITSRYPYKSTLPFVDLEMPVLNSRFDKIITLSIDADKGAEKKPVSFDKLESYIAASGKIKSEKVTAFGRALLKLFSKSELYRTDMDEIGESLKKKVFFEYFCARAEYKYKLCKKALEKYDFSSFDSVTVYSYWFFISALVGSMLSDDLKRSCANVRFVSRAHRYEVYENRNFFNYLPLRRYLLNKADCIYVCSQNGADHIRSRYPEFSDKIKCSYLGTFDGGISRTDGGGFHIVSCSQASEVKRINRIVTSLALLEDFAVKSIRWTHIGDGVTFSSVKKLAGSSLSKIKAEFLGNISNAEVKEYYKNNPVDLFVNVSANEGVPVSIMEAVSFGIPVIATDVGGTGEIVKDGFNGRLLQKDFKDEELADLIKEMCLADEEETCKMRSNARDFWQKHFNAEKNYRLFADELAGNKRTDV